MRRSVALLAAALCGCPVEEPRCDRQMVALNNELGAAGIVLPGERARVPVVAPLRRCFEDRVSAAVSVFDPASDEVAASITFDAGDGDGVIAATVEFTPLVPGRYLLRVVFDPSLGGRTFPVDVTHPFSDAGVRIEIPASTTCGAAWPVNADTIACESFGSVMLFSNDGGLVAFPGDHLVTVGQVLWSISDGGWLERRVLDGGALELTHRWSNLRPGNLRGEHTATSAIRETTSGDIEWVGVDGGLIFELKGNHPFESIFLEQAGVIRSPCLELQCRDTPDSLVAWDSDVLWSADRFRQISGSTAIGPHFRPLDGTTSATIISPRLFLARSKSIGAWHRAPLFLRDGDLTTEVLVSSQGWSQWPANRIEHVGDGFVVMRETQSSFVIAPIPR